MTEERTNPELIPLDVEDQTERVPFDFAPDRRQFVQMLGAGLLITVLGETALAQRSGRGGRGGGGAEDLEAVGPVM